MKKTKRRLRSLEMVVVELMEQIMGLQERVDEFEMYLDLEESPGKTRNVRKRLTARPRRQPWMTWECAWRLRSSEFIAGAARRPARLPQIPHPPTILPRPV